MTSFSVNYPGKKTLKFPDGQTIVSSIPSDTFCNVMMGTIYRWIHGKIEYWDNKNNLYAYVDIGNVKKHSQEYFEGEIQHKGKCVSKVFGNYCGYMEIGGERWWDHRKMDEIW